MERYWDLFWATGLPEAWALSRRGPEASPAQPRREPEKDAAPAPAAEAKAEG